jgi:uncharacterized protein
MRSILLFISLLTLCFCADAKDSLYRAQAASLQTPTGTVHGTLLVPASKKKMPLVLFISGSGPTDRDGNNPMMKNNSVRLLAEGLSEKGFATLRYDKRGVAASRDALQNEAALRFDDYVEDAAAWIHQLRQDQRFSKIIVAGHSEGSLIGIIAAKAADGFISISGSGLPADSLLKKQFAAQPKPIQMAANVVLDSLRAGHAVKQVPLLLLSVFRPSVQPYMISWFKYDPRAELRKLNIPVLIVQGSTDLQVTPEDARTLHAANPKAKLKIIKNMNHVLKEVGSDKAANTKTYIEPSLPLHPKLLQAVYKFCKKFK